MLENLALGTLPIRQIILHLAWEGFQTGTMSASAEGVMTVDGLNFDARPDPNNARFNAGVARNLHKAITIDLKNVDFLLIQKLC